MIFPGKYTDLLYLRPYIQEFLYKMKLLFILFKGLVASLDHIMHTLSADAQILCDFTQRVILQHHALINLLLSLCQKFSIKII